MPADDRRFIVREQHLKLLDSMWVGWDDCEFGAPAIDCKRPYGNSDVLGDMREILGAEGADDDHLYALHREMQTVLQIGIATRAFREGEYVAPRYGVAWRPVAALDDAEGSER